MEMADEGKVMWFSLVLSYFLLYRAPESWAYANGKVHPEFCPTRSWLTLFLGDAPVAFESRSIAFESRSIVFESRSIAN